MKGDAFFRVQTGPDSPWVCQEHFEGVDMKPEVREKHKTFWDFITGNGRH